MKNKSSVSMNVCFPYCLEPKITHVKMPVRYGGKKYIFTAKPTPYNKSNKKVS